MSQSEMQAQLLINSLVMTLRNSIDLLEVLLQNWEDRQTAYTQLLGELEGLGRSANKIKLETRLEELNTCSNALSAVLSKIQTQEQIVLATKATDEADADVQEDAEEFEIYDNEVQTFPAYVQETGQDAWPKIANITDKLFFKVEICTCKGRIFYVDLNLISALKTEFAEWALYRIHVWNADLHHEDSLKVITLFVNGEAYYHWKFVHAPAGAGTAIVFKIYDTGQIG